MADPGECLGGGIRDVAMVYRAMRALGEEGDDRPGRQWCYGKVQVGAEEEGRSGSNSCFWAARTDSGGG